MALSLAAAAFAALCYGVATVLQALGTRRTEAAGPQRGLDPRLLVRVFGTWPFVAGTLLDLVGFAAQLVALAELPVFAVEAAQSANLAVTAVVAVPVLGVTLGRREWTAVGAVCAGLALLGLSAGHEGPSGTSGTFRYALLGSVAAVGLFGVWAAHRAEPWRSRLLGLGAGLGFGVIAVAGRIVTDVSVADLWADAAAWTVVLAGAVTMLMYATALQGGAVTAVAASLVVGETVLPAAVGVFFLDDRSRPGFVPAAVAGFLLAVAGAVALARFGEGGDPSVVSGGKPDGSTTSAAEPPGESAVGSPAAPGEGGPGDGPDGGQANASAC